MLQPDTELNDRYRTIEPVGEGGMATVYRALDTRLGRTVAVKVLHPEFSRDQPFLQRFQQEAEFAASLGAHPSIVDIYDIGQDGGLHYIVMEFVEGKTLKDLIEEKHQFEVPEAFAIGQQVASALDFAHKRGLVHRDVKPQNILVTPEGVAKVTDFGIARGLSASQLTRTGMVIGTVHYFSPEQAQGKPLGAASDIYSLGIILYEMLTGHLPFDAENAIGVAMQHLHSDPPPPWDYNPDLPARAVATVLRALEKDPEQRYRDAAEFASALASQASPVAGPGGTTALHPLVDVPRQRTAVHEVLAPPPPIIREDRVVAEPRRQARPVQAPPAPSRSRARWIALSALLLAIILGAAGFFYAPMILGGAGGTPTPTRTPKPTARPTPKPTPHRRATAVATSIPVVVLPTSIPPTVALPTWTPIPATSTPKPRPTAVPPTQAPVVVPTTPPVPTIEIFGPTATATASG